MDGLLLLFACLFSCSSLASSFLSLHLPFFLFLDFKQGAQFSGSFQETSTHAVICLLIIVSRTNGLRLLKKDKGEFIPGLSQYLLP